MRRDFDSSPRRPQASLHLRVSPHLRGLRVPIRLLSLARAFRWIYLAVFAAVLIVAALYRFGLSQQPFLDPDAWGYLNPALGRLTGGAFQHAFGRDTLYPAFVFALLDVFGDFRAIGVAQHGFGLLTGVLMALAWDDLCRLLLPNRPLPLLLRLAGLLPAAAYLNSNVSLQYEHSLRPEAVFPFFAMLSLWLNLALIRFRWFERAPVRAAVLATGALIAPIILFKLKPAFGFGVIVAALPALISLGQPGMTRRLKIGVIAAVIAAASTLLVPEYLLRQTDPLSQTFLPDTLFAIHADLIADQMGDDLAHEIATPFPREILEAVRARLLVVLAASRRPENRPYGTLGFNPDYLLFIQNPFAVLPGTRHEQRIARMAIENYYYRRTALQQPGRLVRKILREMAQFYSFGSHTKPGLLGTVADPVSAFYGRNVTFLNTPVRSSVAAKFNEYDPARALRADSLRLSQTSQPISPNVVSGAIRDLLCWLYFPGLLGALILAAWQRGCQRLWLALIYGYNFGNNLTIAIVHSLVADRYVANELSFTLFASAAGLLFIGVTVRDRLQSAAAGSVSTTSSISEGNSTEASPKRPATSGA